LRDDHPAAIYPPSRERSAPSNSAVASERLADHLADARYPI
jgi:hypothetical protein